MIFWQVKNNTVNAEHTLQCQREDDVNDQGMKMSEYPMRITYNTSSLSSLLSEMKQKDKVSQNS